MGCALDQALRRLNFIQGDSFAGAGRADFGKVAKMAYDLERAAATLADEKTPLPDSELSEARAVTASVLSGGFAPPSPSRKDIAEGSLLSRRIQPSGSPDSQHPVLTWNAKRLEFVSGTGLPGALPSLRVSGGIAGTLVMALVMIVFVFWAISLGHFGGAAAAGATIWLILILAIKFALLDLVYLPYKLKRLYFAHIMTNGTGFSLQKEDKKRLGAAKCDSSYLSRSFFARKAGLRLGAFLGLVGSALVLFIFGDAGNAVTCLVIGAIVWFFALSGSKGDKLDKRLGKLDETLSA